MTKTKQILFFLIEKHGEYFFHSSFLLCLSVHLYKAQTFGSHGKSKYTSNIYSIVGPEFLEFPPRKKKASLLSIHLQGAVN